MERKRKPSDDLVTKVTTGAGLAQAAVATGIARRRPAAATGAVHRQPAAATKAVHRQPAAATGAVHRQPAAATKAVRRQPAAAAGAVHRQPAASAIAIPRQPAAATKAVRRQPAVATGAVRQQPAAATGAIPRQPAAATGAVHRQPAAATGAVRRQPAAATGAIHRQPSASAIAIPRQPAAATGAVHRQPAAATGAIPRQQNPSTGAIPRKLTETASPSSLPLPTGSTRKGCKIAKLELKIPEPEQYPGNQLEILMEMLPDADPDYLSYMCNALEGNLDVINIFINQAMVDRNYPTMKEYRRKQKLSAQQKQYTTQFTIENFLKVIPDPVTFFNDKQRTVVQNCTTNSYAIQFLKNTFDRVWVHTIEQIFQQNQQRLTPTYKELVKIASRSDLLNKTARPKYSLFIDLENIPLLQEIAFLTHAQEIEDFMQQAKANEEAEILYAKNNGLVVTCNCCYDEDILPRNVIPCEKGCEFCKACVVQSVEILFGEGKLDFPCLQKCSANFSLQTLQVALPSKLFSILAQKKAVQEIQCAGIEEIEGCPFCDFFTIPVECSKVFTCLNPDCMMESCRQCKEPSHLPLRCEEVEKDNEVQARVFLENKMTEALLRTCWKCGLKFFKTEGCNKMTCSCGAMMCYLCRNPVTDYNHFKGVADADRLDLCPLITDNYEVNKMDVLRAAKAAKEEIGGDTQLKNDPSKGIEQYFNDQKANAMMADARPNVLLPPRRAVFPANPNEPN